MRSDELVAAALLAELLEATVVPNDAPGLGDGRHDWNLDCRNGRRVAMEVTMHADSDTLSFWRDDDQFREIPNLGGKYRVTVAATANRRLLWKHLPALLTQFKDEFVDVENTPFSHSDPRRQAAERLVSLGVRWVGFSRDSEASAVALMTSGGGALGASVAARAAIGEMEANSAKLARAAGVHERHLFVWVDGSAWHASLSLRQAASPPSDPIDLEDGIDVLWVAAVDSSRRPITASVLWRATAGRWEDWTPSLVSRLPGPS